jgi:hypothetical protein
MSDDSNGAVERESLAPDRRATPAGIDIVALCRSLPPSGRLSDDDLKVLRDWTARYQDIDLPSHGYISSVVTKALSEQVLTADERNWVYFAVEPVLPIQLRKGTHERRRIAELREAQLEGRADANLSFDFLLAGVHLDGHWRTIQSRVKPGDAVHLVRNAADQASGKALRVVLPTGECIGYVPEEDALPIAPEVARGASVAASVKKILADGQYPIPVIGGRIHISAETLDESVDEPLENASPVEEPASWRRPSRSALTAVVCLIALIELVWFLR